MGIEDHVAFVGDTEEFSLHDLYDNWSLYR
jgi:hypothetical protein